LQLEELEEGRRRLQQKDRELSQLSERLSRVQADQEQADEELKRMKRSESWARRTPTLSPSSSLDELSSPVGVNRHILQWCTHALVAKYG